MTTHTFLTVLAWPLCLFTGLIILLNLEHYLSLRVKPKGWAVFIVFELCLWWLTCN